MKGRTKGGGSRFDGTAGFRSRAVTLTDVACYFTVVAVVSIPVTLVILNWRRALRVARPVKQATEHHGELIFRLSSEVQMSIKGTAQVENRGRRLTFVPPHGFDERGALPGEAVTFELVPAENEIENGRDDNGNGLVDEGNLIRSQVDHVITLAEDLSLSNSSFSLVDSGAAVHVKLTNLRSRDLSVSGAGVTREITISPRN